MSNFQITGIDHQQYQHLFELNASELQEFNAVKQIVDAHPGYPCRVSLEDAEVGEEVLLFTYEHHQTDSPYQAQGPIFIRKNARPIAYQQNEIPPILKHRLLSLRAYDQAGMMIDAQTLEGKIVKEGIQQIFKNQSVQYIHIHNASPGCYNCQVNRLS